MPNPQELEEMDYRPMSEFEMEEGAVRQEGYRDLDRQWLSTNFDTWVENPYYAGEPQRHPEEEEPKCGPFLPEPKIETPYQDGLPF